jgi:hypothetical protein
MTRTNWNRFSEVALIALLVVGAAAMPAAAISVGETDVQESAAVDSQVTATVQLTDLYKDPQLEAWTLAGETALRNVTWTVTYIDQTGAKVGQESFDGQEFDGASIAASDGTAEVEVRVRGTVPEVTEYSYDPPQSFLVMELEQTREGGSSTEIERLESQYYTSQSQSARTALDEAQAAIESAAGADTQEAERTFDNAVDAYESENFDLATELANEATERANSARQSQQTFQLALYAVGGLLIVGLLVGGFLYWRSQQETYDRLG